MSRIIVEPQTGVTMSFNTVMTTTNNAISTTLFNRVLITSGAGFIKLLGPVHMGRSYPG